jgi:hypothetical protein
VLTRNANPSKVDAYLERDVDYDVTWDPATGRERATVTIRMTNTAPVGQVPEVVVQPPVGAPVGTNRTQLSVLSPLGATGASIDGAPTGIGTQQELAGVLRHSILLDIPPGGSRVVTLDLDGTVGRGTYVLDWIGQPMVAPGRTEVTIASSGDPLPTPTGTVQRTFKGDEDARVTVRTTDG